MSRALIQNVLGAVLPNVDHAEGIWIYDAEGRRYLDGCSGAMAVTIGHSHPRVVDAMRAQAGKVTFTHRGAFASEALVSLADTLAEATGYAGVWFVNSGSEAVEAAMQFAVQYHRENGQDKTWFLSQSQSYHGNTLGALSLSGHSRRGGFGQLAYPFPQLPSPYTYRNAGASTEAAFVERLLGEAEDVIATHADNLAGVIFEPVGGATLGATVPPVRYIQGLRDLCTKYGTLLIADEVMTGLGRTGTMLAVEHFDVEPDLVTLGKGLASGYTPVAATLVSERVLNAMTGGSGRSPGGHTYAGNPFSIAVASAVIDVLLEENLVERGAKTGEYLASRLQELADRHAIIGDARGMGMLRGLEFVQDKSTKEVLLPQGELARRVVAAAMGRGLIIYPSTGGYNDACLIAPPLVTTTEEVDELIVRLEGAITAVESELRDCGGL